MFWVKRKSYPLYDVRETQIMPTPIPENESQNSAGAGVWDGELERVDEVGAVVPAPGAV